MAKKSYTYIQKHARTTLARAIRSHRSGSHSVDSNVFRIEGKKAGTKGKRVRAFIKNPKPTARGARRQKAYANAINKSKNVMKSGYRRNVARHLRAMRAGKKYSKDSLKMSVKGAGLSKKSLKRVARTRRGGGIRRDAKGRFA